MKTTDFPITWRFAIVLPLKDYYLHWVPLLNIRGDIWSANIPPQVYAGSSLAFEIWQCQVLLRVVTKSLEMILPHLPLVLNILIPNQLFYALNNATEGCTDLGCIYACNNEKSEIQNILAHKWYAPPVRQLPLVVFTGNTTPRVHTLIETKESQSLVRREITLSKHQVAFLIGRNGERIEHLRSQSGAAIQVVPLNVDRTSMEVRREIARGTIEQDIIITGNNSSVSQAIALIENELSNV